MEIEALIKKMKDIYQVLMNFIDSTDNSDSEFDTLTEILDNQEILQNKEVIQLIFQLISKISDNHHQTTHFFKNLEKIFQYFIKDKPSPISCFIPKYKDYNIRVLFFLLKNKFIIPDQSFIEDYLESKTNQSYYYYLYPCLKEYIEESIQKQTESEIFEKFEKDFTIFEEKCQIGQNNSYICSLIQEDLVEEFISYVNRTNLSLSTKIKPIIYETNSFLIDKEPTLIEYAAFFGSIQIIRYLKYNKIQLNSSLWLYAIHSNNPELIHFLEDNEVEPGNNKFLSKGRYYLTEVTKDPFNDVFIESIICHHNDISNYIMDNLLEQNISNDQYYFYKNFSSSVVDSLNFFFFPLDIVSLICKSNNEKRFHLSQLCFSLTQITIPSSVTSIGKYAFKECSSLTQITIPSSVTSIGKYAFSECSSLAQISIPSSITRIGINAFYKCSSLAQISIPSSVTFFGYCDFSKCSSLAQISFETPSSLTIIGDFVFIGCSSLRQMSIPSSVTSIKHNTFRECTSLTQISFETPSSVKSIGDFAFFECSSLTQITIPSSVTLIGDCSFFDCSSLTQISFETPSSLISIGQGAFCKCSSLRQMSIPSSVTSIRHNAFRECTSLTQISFETPSSLISIGQGAFCNCSSLRQMSIPSSVTSIGKDAFALTPLLIPPKVTSI